MFALQRAPFRAHTLRFARATGKPQLGQRQFSIEPLTNGFLDLALALPIPPSLPPYSTTIIIVTIVSRLALLPITIWGMKRSERLTEIVIPQVYKDRQYISHRVREKMQEERITIRANQAILPDIYKKRYSKALHQYYQSLLIQHRCSPWTTFILPIVSQVPVFLGTTYLLSKMSIEPTPFADESFLTLASLAHPDPTMTLPIVLGCLTLMQVESGNWLLSASDRQAKLESDMSGTATPGQAVKSILRGLSVVRVIWAALIPGSIELYWVTSAAFGLGQTWGLNWYTQRRKARLASKSSTKQNPPLPKILQAVEAKAKASQRPSPRSRKSATKA